MPHYIYCSPTLTLFILTLYLHIYFLSPSPFFPLTFSPYLPLNIFLLTLTLPTLTFFTSTFSPYFLFSHSQSNSNDLRSFSRKMRDQNDILICAIGLNPRHLCINFSLLTFSLYLPLNIFLLTLILTRYSSATASPI